MKNLCIWGLLFLVGCSIIETNENLVSLPRKYKTKDIEVPNNCYFLYGNYVKINNDDKIMYISWFTRNGEKKYEELNKLSDDNKFSLLSESCEICKTEYPEEYKIYKKIIDETHKEKLDYDKEVKEKQEKIEKFKNELSSKYGYPWCSNDLNTNCIFAADKNTFKTVQQIYNGTIVEAVSVNLANSMLKEIYGGDAAYLMLNAMGVDMDSMLEDMYGIKNQTTLYFVTSNDVDVSIPDNSYIPAGIFILSGIFQYENLLGNTKTISKLQRIK